MKHIRRYTVSAAVVTAALVAFGCSAPKGTGATASRHDAGLSLTPDPPNASTQLAVVLDLPGVDPGRCEYVWQRNGSVISGASGPNLPPDQFHKGDLIKVEVQVPDAAKGKPPLTAETQVADSPPVVVSASIMLANTAGSPLLQAHAEAQDADGETVTHDYTWFKNDSRIDGASGDALPVTGLTPSDLITVEVVARAGGVASVPRRSEAFSLDNRPPQFSAAPAALSPGQAVLRYQAAATDPDGDAITFELVEAPPGMTITPAGAIEWSSFGDARKGDYKVTLRAVDTKGGSSTQSFVIRASVTKQ